MPPGHLGNKATNPIESMCEYTILLLADVLQWTAQQSKYSIQTLHRWRTVPSAQINEIELPLSRLS